MESYRIQQTATGTIGLEVPPGELKPVGTKSETGGAGEELEPFSRIIAELNDRFGLHLVRERRLTLAQMMGKLDGNAALKTIAAFLKTEGGDLLIGVADDGTVVGIERDGLANDDEFMRHLAQVVRNALGDRAGTCIDPKTQVVDGKTVCVASCQRSPEQVFLRWKRTEAADDGDFFVRSGPSTVRLSRESAAEYVRTRYGRVGG